MSEPYQEIVQGETLLRLAPGARHEMICARLHERMAMCVARSATMRLLSPRSIVELATGTLVRPDLALMATATNKAWLIAEIIDSSDHSTDTVTKKSLYEDLRMPRLWMVDPRYDNVEVYHGTQYGLALREVLAGRDLLQERLVAGFEFSIAELFSD